MAQAYDASVSDVGPLGPGDEDDNPFSGMPFFGDLAKMLQNQGAMSWDAARQLALTVATGGVSEPNVEPADRIALEELARVAQLQVEHATGFNTAACRVTAVTRSAFARSALDTYRPLFDDLAASLQAPEAPTGDPDPMGSDASDPTAFLGPIMKLIGPMMLGMTAGSMVGHLAQRSLGPYSLPVPRPSDQIGIVLANVDEFGTAWSLPSDDLRLWVCLHEIAHHAVLGVPHVRSRLERHLHEYLSGFEPDPSALETKLAGLDLADPSAATGLEDVFNDPEALLGAIQSPAQRELLPHLEALVAVIVGYVDHLLDEVGGTLLASYGQVTEALRRRRVQADPSDRFVERLLGLELSQATYDRGEAFVNGVVEREGTQGLGRLWKSDRNLPTPNEIDAPGLWLARIELPDTD